MGTAVTLAVVALALTIPPARGAESAPVREYTRGCGLAASGELDLALEALGRLASANPAWIAAHHALALTAIEAGGERASATRKALYARVRRSARDVGASVGYGMFLERDGKTEEAHRLYLSALLSGAREPVLGRLLLDSTPSVDGLLDWLQRRASVLPRDGPFAALRAEVLANAGRLDDALRVIRVAARDAPDDPWLTTLRANLLRAAGEETEACRFAEIADGLVAARGGIPEVYVERRLVLARAFLACGRVDDARRLVKVPESLAAPPGVDLAAGVRAVETELRLAAGDPLGALALLDASSSASGEANAYGEAWQEVRTATRARTLAGTGLEDLATASILRSSLPRGVAAADRAIALSALAAAAPARDSKLARRLATVAAELGNEGFGPRAERLRLVAAWLDRSAPGRMSLEPTGRTRAELLAASAIIAGQIALESGDWRTALDAASQDPLDIAAAPGELRAVIAVIAARAALAVDDPATALRRAREGLLDLQEADRSGRDPVPEFRHLLLSVLGSRDPGVLLAGLAFQSRLESGVALAAALPGLLSDLARALRGWSTLPAAWPEDAESLAASLPPDACLVVATGAGGPDAVALGSGTPPRLSTGPEAARAGPCATADVVLWLGPQSAPGGLTVSESDRRLLVRLTGVAAPVGPRASRSVPHAVGSPVEGALAVLVGQLAGAPPPGAGGPQESHELEGWPVFYGAGLTIPRWPEASGWIVSAKTVDPRGWLAPESIPALEGLRGAGLVSLGLRALPADGPSRGERVLADAALEAGLPWALLAARPLDEDERERLLRLLPSLGRDLPAGVARLVEREPQLADALRLWSVLDPWSASESGSARRLALPALIAGIALVTLAALARMVARRGRRRR